MFPILLILDFLMVPDNFGFWLLEMYIIAYQFFLMPGKIQKIYFFKTAIFWMI